MSQETKEPKSFTRYHKNLFEAEQKLIKEEGYRLDKAQTEKGVFAIYLKDTDTKTVTARVIRTIGHKKGDCKTVKTSVIKPNTPPKTANTND